MITFEEWEPVYEAILADFGYDRAADARARDRLAALHAGPSHPFPTSTFAGQTVAIVGAAPSLVEDLDRVRTADRVVAASTAASVCRARGIEVDCLVTDLDGSPEPVRELASAGSPVAIHAHGDNIPLLERVVPDLPSAQVIPTTQARPTHTVHNVGGFTDGDRAAFLADALGASRLVFPGWDFDDPNSSATKRQKLAWAARLLYWLECRRNERFGVLDGRRDALSLPPGVTSGE